MLLELKLLTINHNLNGLIVEINLLCRDADEDSGADSDEDRRERLAYRKNHYHNRNNNITNIAALLILKKLI